MIGSTGGPPPSVSAAPVSTPAGSLLRSPVDAALSSPSSSSGSASESIPADCARGGATAGVGSNVTHP
jgi:hypothetical protein